MRLTRAKKILGVIAFTLALQGCSTIEKIEYIEKKPTIDSVQPIPFPVRRDNTVTALAEAYLDSLELIKRANSQLKAIRELFGLEVGEH